MFFISLTTYMQNFMIIDWVIEAWKRTYYTNSIRLNHEHLSDTFMNISRVIIKFEVNLQ